MLASPPSFSESDASLSSSSAFDLPPFCVSPSSPVFASHPASHPLALHLPRPRERLPAYASAPPPTYSRRPALTITVARATFDALASASSLTGSLDNVLSLALDPTTDADDRQREREDEARARLMPFLFPKSRGVKGVVKNVFGRRKKHGIVTGSDAPLRLDELDDFERQVAMKMYSEYVDRCEHLGF